MKTIVLGILLVIGQLAQAGSANCSNVSHLSESPQYYSASHQDCVLSYERTSFTAVEAILPSNPSVGEFFRVEDHTDFQYDHCDVPYWDDYENRFVTLCYPAPVSVVSYNNTNPIAGVQEIANAGYYDQIDPYRYTMEFTFNGSSEWDLNFYNPFSYIKPVFFVKRIKVKHG